METGIETIVTIAIPAVLLAALVVIHLVRKDLNPVAALTPGGQWLLTLAFGMGLVAFSLKMAVAMSMATAPQRLISPLAASFRHFPSDQSADWSKQFTPSAAGGTYVWQALPDQAPEPQDNPTTTAKVALGKRLFNENKLSKDGSMNCASCHDLFGQAGADGLGKAQGIQGQGGGRNTPSVWNAAFQSVLFWDGRVRSLEEQAAGPILNPIEMGMTSRAEVERRLQADPGYREAFAQVFGGKQAVRFDNVVKALAAYERSLITPDSAYDRFVRGDTQALTPSQIRGMALFESNGCVSCHQGPGFSDASKLGGRSALRLFPTNPSEFDRRYNLLADAGASQQQGKNGLWRVPSLRNVALTGPYLHNGAVKELTEVVRIMATAQLGATLTTASAPAPQSTTAQWSPETRTFKRQERRILHEQDIEDIADFLRSISSDALLAARASTENARNN